MYKLTKKTYEQTDHHSLKFQMDADYDPTAPKPEGSSKKKSKKAKKKAGFADVVKNERPVFDPGEWMVTIDIERRFRTKIFL